MQVLVTGGSGTIGKYIVSELIKHHKVGILDIKEPECPQCRFHWADIMNLPALIKILSEYDAVVHLAGIPHPLDRPPEKVFTTNVFGTFNIMEAACKTKVKKVIFASSESTLGFAFRTKNFSPEYFPIDENHPLQPQDPYGLSKVCCEQILKSYSLKTEIQTISLRMPWVWVPEKEMVDFYKNLVSEYDKWHKNLWAYIHVFDAAQAFASALLTEGLLNHETFFITADENWTGIESRKLIQTHYPSTKSIDEKFSGRMSLITSNKAKQKLGYLPKYSFQDLIKQINNLVANE
jgi:UDP-glucose 4-epimerase